MWVANPVLCIWRAPQKLSGTTGCMCEYDLTQIEQSLKKNKKKGLDGDVQRSKRTRFSVLKASPNPPPFPHHIPPLFQSPSQPTVSSYHQSTLLVHLWMLITTLKARVSASETPFDFHAHEANIFLGVAMESIIQARLSGDQEVQLSNFVTVRLLGHVNLRP